jgi:hypothetical protein
MGTFISILIAIALLMAILLMGRLIYKQRLYPAIHWRKIYTAWQAWLDTRQYPRATAIIIYSTVILFVVALLTALGQFIYTEFFYTPPYHWPGLPEIPELPELPKLPDLPY